MRNAKGDAIAMRQAMTDDVLTLARQVSQRFEDATGQCDSHATPEKHHATGHETPLARERGEKVVYGLSLVEIEREAGAAFWEEIKGEPQTIEKFARDVSESRQLGAGVTPDTYTETIHCRKCGDVPVPPYWMVRYSNQVNNCRWCFVGGYK